MNKKNILSIFFAIVMSTFVLFLSGGNNKIPMEVYRVYLKGKTIGYIDKKEALDDYIDKEQVQIKEKYNVEKVYAPNDLKVVKEVVYNQKTLSEAEIYSKIKEEAPFTINGYRILIKGTKLTDEAQGEITTEDVIINVLSKEIFEEAIKEAIFVFVSESDYNNFVDGTQEEIKEVGTIIEDMYLKNKITIKETKLSTGDKIYTDSDELSKYLLFGTTEESKKYIVKEGDTIEDITFKNKMSINGFLIVNSQFTSEDNLLYAGQEVNVGDVNPKFVIMEENHVVEIQSKRFETKIEYDSSKTKGYEALKQDGADGQEKVYKKVQLANGNIESAVVTRREILKESIPRIIVRGNKVVSEVAIPGIWAYPIQHPNQISSGYGYRTFGGKTTFHEGIDFWGNRGEPIWASNNGVVVESGNRWPDGKYVLINHNNGYYTLYAHMSEVYVKVDQVVEIKQQIGEMGRTGLATGVHLHFGLYDGYPYRGGHHKNPLSLFR